MGNHEKVLVSILTTTYNREKYIGSAIRSILASSFINFELIVVDDCSDDSTVEIARHFELTDSRVKVYVNETNLGDYLNRNKAASYAKGKYIKYVDADDLIYPDGLKILVESMEKFPDAGWGLCSLMQDEKRIFPFMLTPEEAYQYHYKGPGLFHKAPLSSIIRRDVFEAVGGFKNIRMAGDYEMWHRLAQNYPVVLMQIGLVWYRSHEEQEMADAAAYVSVYEKIKISYLRDNKTPLANSVRAEILVREKKSNLFKLLKSIVFLRLNLAWQYYKRLIQYFK